MKLPLTCYTFTTHSYVCLRSICQVYVTLVLCDVVKSLALKYAYIWFINVPHLPLGDSKGVTPLKLLSSVVRGLSSSEFGSKSQSSKPKVQGSTLENYIQFSLNWSIREGNNGPK